MGHAPEGVVVDGLMAVNVLYFMEDLVAFAARCGQWLRPAGRAIFGVRSQQAIAATPLAEHGFHARSVDEVFRALAGAGFASIEAKFFDEGIVALDDYEIEVDTIIVSATRPQGEP
jgi:predicted TPR repeat methyltransferase